MVAQNNICEIRIYLLTVLPYSYYLTMDHAINAPVHENDVVGGLNATDKSYLKEKNGTYW